MKHIKLYENHKKNYYIVNFITPSFEVENILFDNVESAKDYIIQFINEKREEYEFNEFSDEMLFTDINKALDWYDQNIDKPDDLIITYEGVTLTNFEFDDKMKKLRELRKNTKNYNL